MLKLLPLINSRQVVCPALLATILLTAGCGESVENNGEMAQAHLSRSEAYEKQGQFKAAIIEAQNVLKKDPDNAQGHIRLARLLQAIGNSRSAISVLEPVAGAANSPEVFLLLAECYNDTGKYHSANDALANYTRSGGDKNGEYTLAFATTLVGLKDRAQAVAVLKSLVPDRQYSAEAKTALAKLYLANQQFGEAQRLVDGVLEQQPQNPEALYVAAQLAYLKNDLDGAEKFLSNALIALPESDFIKPLRAKVLTQLSSVLTEQGRTAEALIYAKLLASENPELHEAKSQLTAALRKLEAGELQEAEAMLTELNAQYPTYEPGTVYLGIVSYQQGKFDKADELLSASIDPETAAPRLISAGAINKLRLNQVDESLQLLQDSLRSHPDNESLLSLYGQIAISQHGTEKAGAMALEKAIAINPDNMKNRALLANYYAANGKPELGRAQISQGLKSAPDDPEVVAAYANFMTRQGDQASAEKAVAALLAQAADNPQALTLGARYAIARKDLATAKSYLQKATAIDADNYEALAALADIAVLEGRLDDAIDRYTRLMQSYPSEEGSYKGIISAYELKQQPGKGLALVKDMSLQKTHSAANAVLAEYYLRKQRFDRAAEYYEKSLPSSNPASAAVPALGATIYYEWARKNLADGDFGLARRNLLTASGYSPNSPALLGLLAETEIRARRFDEAKRIIQNIAGLYPNAAQADLLSGKLLQLQGDQAGALAAYRSGWNKEPSDLSGQLVYQSLQRTAGEQQSSEFLQEWLDRMPRSQAARMARATQLQLAGEADEARVMYESLLEENPNNLTAWNNLAWLYDGIDYQRASEIARKAYALAPDNPSVLDTYGWFLFKAGQVADGVDMLELALSKMPDNKEILSHLEQARKAL